MFLVVLVVSLFLSGSAQEADNDWIDPFDMLNYDSSTKTMRQPAEPVNYENVPTKRREFTRDSNQEELTSCNTEVVDLKREVGGQRELACVKSSVKYLQLHQGNQCFCR
ncbi:chloride channel CLIC-like protein 1 [Notothenia coriiceps]|uniref:Chloride channel CLIC-like protein 1 n=1 Tax=Notothenia coriiceps TaxID=8208 RepID=A0A6I9MXH4_9TELE|nr:PREDICTED: chloride channel CLIC-like protein 1 [Notothenia coriiceps]